MSKEKMAVQVMTNRLRFIREVQKSIIGNEHLINDVLMCMLCNGDALLEGMPGVGKTTFAQAFAEATNGSSAFFQGFADDLPSDLIGSYIWQPRTQELVVRYGKIPPVNLIIADEVNRLEPKAQGALLGVQQQKVLLIGDLIIPMPDPCCMLATENPIDLDGTYPLTPPNVDRFALKIIVNYVEAIEEEDLYERQSSHARNPAIAAGTQKVLTMEQVLEMREFAQSQVTIEKAVMKYIVRLVRATRPQCPDQFRYMPAEFAKMIRLGASPRGGLWLTALSRARAALEGRSCVTFEDIQSLAVQVLAHRLILTPQAKFTAELGIDRRIIERLVESVPTVQYSMSTPATPSLVIRRSRRWWNPRRYLPRGRYLA